MVVEKAEMLAAESIKRFEDRIRERLEDGTIELHLPLSVVEMFKDQITRTIANGIIRMTSKFN